jgi:acetyltransferase-like isoleucine patch superfamily enzyme
VIHYINTKHIFMAEGSGINSEGILEAAANGEGNIYIGKHTQIGAYIVINALQHRYKDPTRRINSQGHDHAHVTIGDDCWLGARVTILYGSTIPDGCVIGAGSTVTRHDKLEPYCLYVGGFPLRKIGKRE